MTQIWDENNRVVPVTVVAAGTNVVTQVRHPETDGYNAVQIGFGEIEGRKVTKPQAGHFAKAGVTPRRHLVEIRTADAASYTVGQELSRRALRRRRGGRRHRHQQGQGLRRRHEASRLPRRRAPRTVRTATTASPARSARCATPGRVFKGMRMAGRMGGDTVTTQNLTVHAVDAEKGLILLKGAVPGPKGGARGHPLAPRRRPDHAEEVIVSDRRKHVQGRPARRDLRRPGQHPADPPGRRGPAGRRAPGHARHQDPRRGPRRWPQAVQAEGHRPRPSGLDPRAAVRRRWRRPRPAAARATTSAPPRR